MFNTVHFVPSTTISVFLLNDTASTVEVTEGGDGKGLPQGIN
jgi:hypothetical protein